MYRSDSRIRHHFITRGLYHTFRWQFILSNSLAAIAGSVRLGSGGVGVRTQSMMSDMISPIPFVTLLVRELMSKSSRQAFNMSMSVELPLSRKRTLPFVEGG